jgi:outer membrane biogenesis lipoprotein LolB
MRLLAPLLLTLLLCGCSGPKRVGPAEFKHQYAWVGKPQTMQSVTYLGQRDGRAYVQISAMSSLTKKWSDRVVYVELSKLDAAFRDSLPKTEMKDTR